MNPSIQVEILSREFVKPSCDTPNHKRIHKLSFFDQVSPRVYVPLVLFYDKDTCGESVDSYRLPDLLKQSLSQALSIYYPLAGRIQDDTTIECNDEGVIFLEARTSCKLWQILKHPAEQSIKALFPDDLQYKDSITGGRLAVQVTCFDCGGMAIATCMCHKTLDASSMSSFINNWAAMSRGIYSDEVGVSPEFDIASLYPQVELPVLNHVELEQIKTVSRRLVFDPFNTAKLKAAVADKVPNPTKVEVVSALIYKCAISAARKLSGFPNPTIMNQAVDLRKRVFPPLPEGYEGNLTGVFAVSTADESKIELDWLVGEIRREKTKYMNRCAKKQSAEELCSFVLESSKGLVESRHGKKQDVYNCSSWCRFPFYEADFGWGKPAWATTSCELRNVFVLMDNRGRDGIEALVTLSEQEMSLFEQDKDLLQFASIYPTI